MVDLCYVLAWKDYTSFPVIALFVLSPGGKEMETVTDLVCKSGKIVGQVIKSPNNGQFWYVVVERLGEPTPTRKGTLGPGVWGAPLVDDWASMREHLFGDRDPIVLAGPDIRSQLKGTNAWRDVAREYPGIDEW